MSLKLDEVRKVAELARLQLSESEESQFCEQLGQIVDSFGQLQRFDVATPETTVVDSQEAEDQIADSLDRDLFLANAPLVRDGFLMVPKVKITPGEDS